VVEPRFELPRTSRPGLPALVVDRHPFERASELLAGVMRNEIEARGDVRLAIPGGSVLWTAVLARAKLGDLWRKVRLTWIDERCVPFDDAESNQGAAGRSGLFEADGRGNEKYPAEPDPARVLPLYRDGESPDAAVARVAKGLTEDFQNELDVVLLGMGSDGHIASLFPTNTASSAGLVIHVGNSPKPPSDRISLTREALASARHLILVAAGKSKRDAVERLLAGDERLPAHGLEGLVVVTDLEGVEARGEEHG
jgi:6-phosphogluconolactonase